MLRKINKAIIGSKALYALNIKRDPAGFIPPTLVIMLSDRCNYRCVTCKCYEIGDKERELSTDGWMAALADFNRLHGISVRFTGGEVFLRRKTLYELIDRLNNYGISAKISTNGSLIRSEDIETLKKLKVDLVEISFHGREKNHEDYVKIRGSWQRTLDVIDRLKDAGIIVRLAFTIIKNNLDDIRYIVELASQKGINTSFNILDNSLHYFKGLDRSLFPNAEEMKRASETLIEMKKKYPDTVIGSVKDFMEVPALYKDSRMPKYYCARVLMNIYADSFGNIYHGCWAMPPSGNLREKGLIEILESTEYETSRKKSFLKQCPGCTCGYQMDIAMSFLKRPVSSQ